MPAAITRGPRSARRRPPGRSSRSSRILVVPERHRAPVRASQPCSGRARLEHAREVLASGPCCRGLIEKSPVVGLLSFVENCVAWAPLSDEPRASRIRMSGRSSRNSCLSAAVRIAPPDVSRPSEERSYFSLAQLVRQRSPEGVADDGDRVDLLALDARPDVVGVEMPRIRSAPPRCPPTCQMLKAAQCAAPCMNGAVGSARMPTALCPLDDRFERRDRPDVEGRAQDVLLAPQHALGHAGGAAGVEDVEIVRA